MDKTYIKVKGRWHYYYRAIDKFCATLNFMLSARRDEEAATRFLKQSIENNVMSKKVVIDEMAVPIMQAWWKSTFCYFSLRSHALSTYYE